MSLLSLLSLPSLLSPSHFGGQLAVIAIQAEMVTAKVAKKRDIPSSIPGFAAAPLEGKNYQKNLGRRLRCLRLWRFRRLPLTLFLKVFHFHLHLQLNQKHLQIQPPRQR